MENLENSQDKYRLELAEEEAYLLLQTHFDGCLDKLVEQLQISQEEGCCYLSYDKK